MTLDIAQLFSDRIDDPIDEVEVPTRPNNRSEPVKLSREQALCDRCQHDEATLYIIHEGESVRRDCAQCGRFIDFPIWLDENAARTYIESQTKCS